MSPPHISAKPDKKEPYKVRVVPPPVTVKLKRVRKRYEVVERPITAGYALEIEKADREKYRLIHTTQEGLNLSDAARSRLKSEDLTDTRQRQELLEDRKQAFRLLGERLDALLISEPRRIALFKPKAGKS